MHILLVHAPKNTTDQGVAACQFISDKVGYEDATLLGPYGWIGYHALLFLDLNLSRNSTKIQLIRGGIIQQNRGGIIREYLFHGHI